MSHHILQPKIIVLSNTINCLSLYKVRDWPYDKDTKENLHGDLTEREKRVRDEMLKRKRKQGKTDDRKRKVLFARTKH